MARTLKTVDDYIASRNAEVAGLMTELRGLIHDALPGVTEEMQYGAPAFLNAHGVAVVYLYGSKKHVNFGFLRSMDLSDPNGVLKGSGKPSKHIRVPTGDPVDTSTLAEFVRQCEHLGA